MQQTHVVLEQYNVPRERAVIPTPGWDGWAGGGGARRFWVSDRVLVGGAILNAVDGQHLRDVYGVTHILSVESERRDEGKGWPNENICWAPFVDVGAPVDEALIHTSLDFASNVLAQEDTILYVHCQLGGGRGPSWSYLVSVGVLGMDAPAALAKLVAMRADGVNPHENYISSIDRGMASWKAMRAASKLFHLYEGFRTELESLMGTQKTDGVSQFWLMEGQKWAQLAQTQSIHEFLSWADTFDISEFGEIFKLWYRNLEGAPDWERWKKLSRKSPYGKPHAFSLDAGTAPTALQHAFHLKMFENMTGKRLTNVDAIVEVGGGSGNFSRMLRLDGYRGPHVIIDLPHTRAVQRLFLGLNEVPTSSTPKLFNGVCLLTEKDIDAVVGMVEGKRIAFVATWSLSETPLAFRAKLFPRLHPSIVQYLVASQWYAWPVASMIQRGQSNAQEPVDNVAYYQQFAKDASHVKWVDLPVPHYSQERYLFGYQT